MIHIQPPLEVHEGHHINHFQLGALGLPQALAPLLVKLLVFLLAEDEDVGSVVVGVVLEHWHFNGFFDGVDQHPLPHLMEGLIVHHVLGDDLQHV